MACTEKLLWRLRGMWKQRLEQTLHLERRFGSEQQQRLDLYMGLELAQKPALTPALLYLLHWADEQELKLCLRLELLQPSENPVAHRQMSAAALMLAEEMEQAEAVLDWRLQLCPPMGSRLHYSQEEETTLSLGPGQELKPGQGLLWTEPLGSSLTLQLVLELPKLFPSDSVL